MLALPPPSPAVLLARRCFFFPGLAAGGATASPSEVEGECKSEGERENEGVSPQLSSHRHNNTQHGGEGLCEQSVW